MCLLFEYYLSTFYFQCMTFIQLYLLQFALQIHVRIGYLFFNRSESPTRTFLVTILWLYKKFKDMKNTHSDEEIRQAISSTCLAYDNMCHMDSLKISKQDLPLPKPFSKAWKLISKVIDSYISVTMWIQSAN